MEQNLPVCALPVCDGEQLSFSDDATYCENPDCPNYEKEVAD